MAAVLSRFWRILLDASKIVKTCEELRRSIRSERPEAVAGEVRVCILRRLSWEKNRGAVAVGHVWGEKGFVSGTNEKSHQMLLLASE